MQLGGCAYTHAIYSSESHVPRLTAASRLCVLSAIDGVYQGDPYEGSGKEVAVRVKNALAMPIPQTRLIDSTDEIEGAQRCTESGAQYMLAPSIQHWEDRATQWSGLRDLIRIQVRLIQLQPPPPKILKTGYFEARNGWLTFVNNPPEELLSQDDGFFWFVRRLVGLPTH